MFPTSSFLFILVISGIGWLGCSIGTQGTQWSSWKMNGSSDDYSLQTDARTKSGALL